MSSSSGCRLYFYVKLREGRYFPMEYQASYGGDHDDSVILYKEETDEWQRFDEGFETFEEAAEICCRAFKDALEYQEKTQDGKHWQIELAEDCHV